jgi:uncharacterized protein (DUF1501 family)
MISRRLFLKAGGVSLVGIGLGGVPHFLANAANTIKQPGAYERRKILVCIFQRGAMDGLMAVSPFNDPYFKAARPNLYMSAAKGQTGSSLIDLDGRFGLHPSLKEFESVFREKRLAIVHGMGSPNNVRSHFAAQDYMESGTPFSKLTTSGWLNRALGLLAEKNPTPFQAVSLTASMPRSFYGDNHVLAMKKIQDFAIQTKGNFKGSSNGALMATRNFEELYDQTATKLLKETGKETFDAIKTLEKINVKNYKPSNKAVYPKSALGDSMKQLAQLIKSDVGLEIGFAESGGWDTHVNQGTETGSFARSAADLSSSIMAFWNDIESYQDDVVVMTMTEFGRTVNQNGSGGTDHGRGSCNFIIGNSVKGGLIHGKVSELSVENLEDKRDLPVTTDFRSVFSEVSKAHLKINSNAVLFPEWSGFEIGIM